MKWDSSSGLEQRTALMHPRGSNARLCFTLPCTVNSAQEREIVQFLYFKCLIAHLSTKVLHAPKVHVLHSHYLKCSVTFYKLIVTVSSHHHTKKNSHCRYYPLAGLTYAVIRLYELPILALSVHPLCFASHSPELRKRER